MEIFDSSTNNNLMQNRLQQLLQRKWLLIILAGFILIFLLILILMLSVPQQKTIPVKQTQPSSTSQPSGSTHQQSLQQPFKQQPEVSPDPRKVEEQMKADEGFANWEQNVKANYPWVIRGPLRTNKYFVYFDLNKKMFIGLLYPKAADNVESMKADIMRQLKEVKGVPIESYKFQWMINPK